MPHTLLQLAAQEDKEDTQLLSTITGFEDGQHSSIDDDETTLVKIHEEAYYASWPPA